MFSPDALISLVTLAGLEIVLGIDNLVFLAIVAGRLPRQKQKPAYRLGLIGALTTRLGLLLTLSFIARLSHPFFFVFGRGISGRDLILLVGGLFLLFKSVWELVKEDVEAGSPGHNHKNSESIFLAVIQIAILDIVFSLDSVITAVGMSNQIPIMASAIVIAVIVMITFAQSIGDFINRNPSVKTLAVAFLVLVGGILIAEGLGYHVDKAMVYFAMGFSLIVELLNIRRRHKLARMR